MKKYRPEQIVGKLRAADVELGKGLTVKEVCRRLRLVSRPITVGVRSTVG
jgi:hypothetical protein